MVTIRTYTRTIHTRKGEGESIRESGPEREREREREKERGETRDLRSNLNHKVA